MKEKFIKKALILALGGFITKILSMVIRIITTRVIGVDGLGLYMLVLPTFNLFITIATLSLPTAISKLVAEGTRNNKKLVLGFLPIAIIFNIFLIIIIIILAPFIANNLLHNEILYYPIISIGITLPFITTSSIIKGYFFGKEKMFPNVLSNMIEQITRIISIVFIIPYLLKINISYAVSGLVFINCLSESLGIVTLLLFMPNKTKINKNDINPESRIEMLWRQHRQQLGRPCNEDRPHENHQYNGKAPHNLFGRKPQITADGLRKALPVVTYRNHPRQIIMHGPRKDSTEDNP